MSHLFYRDPREPTGFSYLELVEATAALDAVPETLRPANLLDLSVHLLAAFVADARISLLSDARGDELADDRDCRADRMNPATGRREPSICFDLNGLRESQAQVGIFTSGTTGRPKLIWHGMNSLTRAVRVGSKYADDVWGFAYHPAHFAGLQVLLQALCNRNPIIDIFELSPEHMHQAIDDFGVTHLSATPTFMRMLCDKHHNHTGVRSITLGGERSSPEIQAIVKRTFPNAKLLNVYASTEVGTLFASQGDEFTIDSGTRTLIRIQDGELHVHRSMLAESIEMEPKLEYFPTGDFVEVTNEEPLRFRVLARQSDFINVGGYKVNPHAVETALGSLPYVLDARVYGKSNSVVGQIVCAEVVPQPGWDFDASVIRSALSRQLSRYEVPQLILLADQIEMSATGKKLRNAAATAEVDHQSLARQNLANESPESETPGSQCTGSQCTGSQCTGSQSTGSQSTGSQYTESQSTGCQRHGAAGEGLSE